MVRWFTLSTQKMGRMEWRLTGRRQEMVTMTQKKETKDLNRAVTMWVEGSKQTPWH